MYTHETLRRVDPALLLVRLRSHHPLLGQDRRVSQTHVSKWQRTAETVLNTAEQRQRKTMTDSIIQLEAPLLLINIIDKTKQCLCIIFQKYFFPLALLFPFLYNDTKGKYSWPTILHHDSLNILDDTSKHHSVYTIRHSTAEKKKKIGDLNLFVRMLK